MVDIRCSDCGKTAHIETHDEGKTLFIVTCREEWTEPNG